MDLMPLRGSSNQNDCDSTSFPALSSHFPALSALLHDSGVLGGTLEKAHPATQHRFWLGAATAAHPLSSSHPDQDLLRVSAPRALGHGDVAGNLPTCRGAQTSPGSLERLCLLCQQNEGCTTCGGEAHSSPPIKITRFFHNGQRVPHMSPQLCWHCSGREGRLEKGKRCLAFQAKNTGCASKIISVE